MQKHTSSNEDCYIECPGGGYASYVEPIGPCLTGCDPDNLFDKLIKFGRSEITELKTSGSIMNGSTHALAKFGMALISQNRLPVNPEIPDQLIEFLHAENRSDVTAKWDTESIVNLLVILIASAQHRMLGA